MNGTLRKFFDIEVIGIAFMIHDSNFDVTRRRALSLAAGAGLGILAGCQDAEVGSMPPVGKSRKEVTGDDPQAPIPTRKGGARPK